MLPLLAMEKPGNPSFLPTEGRLTLTGQCRARIPGWKARLSVHAQTLGYTAPLPRGWAVVRQLPKPE